MATFKKQETVEYKLTNSVEGEGKVWVKKTFTGGDLDIIMSEGGVDAIKKSPTTIVHALLADWDIVDEKGVKFKINRENVKRMSVQDIMGIIQTSGVKEQMGGKKKSEGGEE